MVLNYNGNIDSITLQKQNFCQHKNNNTQLILLKLQCPTNAIQLIILATNMTSYIVHPSALSFQSQESCTKLFKIVYY